MMRNSLRFCWPLLLLLLLLSSIAACQQAGDEPVKVGAVLSLTGAGLGGPERNGILLAQRQVNQNGGIRRRPLQAIV